MRKGKKIFLFEFKDYLVSGKLKSSLKYEDIRKLLESSFVDPKGIAQLLKVIKNVNLGGFSFDPLSNLKEFDEQTLLIQPIIIYSDSAFEFDGFNYLINQYFKESLSKNNFTFRIKNLITIHLDTLITYEDLFRQKNVKFNDLIRGYSSYLDTVKKGFNPEKDKINPENYINFEEFFREILKKKKFHPESPLVFRNLLHEILKK